MAGMKLYKWLITIVAGTFLLQACASTDELFAEYDDKFCAATVPLVPVEARAVPADISAAPVAIEIPQKVLDQDYRWEYAVYFDSDKADVRPADHSRLQINVDTLKELPGYSISLNGYTDHLGNEAYNKALSQKRVDAVTRYLVESLGFDADRIIGSSHGESLTMATGDADPVDEDRRVDMRLLDPSRKVVHKLPTHTTSSVSGAL